MSAPRATIVRDGDGFLYGVRINCPSGDCICHVLPVNQILEAESDHVKGKPHWTWNGSLDRPTFTPSILSRYTIEGEGHHVCHSFVTDGRIQFLEDCTHKLAGQTIDLPEMTDR